MPVSIEGINIPGISLPTKNAWFINAPGAASIYAKTQAKTAEQKKKDEETAKISELGGIIGSGGYAIMNAIANNTDPNTLDPETADYLKNKVGKYVKENNMTAPQIGKALTNALNLSAKVDEMVQRQTQPGLQGIERGRGIAAAGGNPMMQLSGAELSRQMGMPLGQAEQALSQYYGGGRNVGRLPFEESTYGIATGGQPPKPATKWIRNAKGEWVQIEAGQPPVMGYTKPTTPEKPLRQLVPVQNADGTTTYIEAGAGTTIPTPKPPLKTIPTEQVKGLKAFDDLAILAKSLKGIGTKYAGPVKGRMKLYSSKFFADPEFIKAKTNLAKLMPVVYALSGKQINEWEMEWLKNDILPNLTSPGENFEATLDQFIDWVNTKSSSLKEGYKQAGYNLPENKPDPLGIR